MEGQGDCLVTASLSVAYNDLSDVWGDLKDVRVYLSIVYYLDDMHHN